MAMGAASILLMMVSLETLLLAAGAGAGGTIRLSSDVPICTRSWPPVCRCADTVERCASTCQHCEQVEEGGPRRYRCLDTHRGDPGPRCGDGEDDGGEWSPTPRLARGHRF
ncbi:Bowman-Birk type trypsin inhibitor [Zea mays]|uniref:Bowman-Birk type trypsin inhibitor n=1 Tax=Zea mays TaxID=4577 RepID=A0A1D6MM95_MAIZE|nr:Bowman-Birk type trypsin inhibitor [Zea mays]